MAVVLENQLSWNPLPSSSGTCKRKSENDIEMSSLKKRRPSAKSYSVDIYEQPRSMYVSFLDENEMPSSSSYIVGERSEALVRTNPSLLLSNFRGTVKLIWYLVADDVRYPHPYILEGDDCVEGVCTKTIRAKGEVISFPGLSIRKVSWKEMEQVLSNRVDRLKQLVPEMDFKMKNLRDYNLRSVKICFQALPQDAVHDYSVILKPVMTKHMHSKDRFRLSDPQIASISESKGTVHGKTEVTLLVSNLKTDDVLVFFSYSSRQPRISWQAFAEILSITPTKHRQASILIHTPPFHDRSITEANTVNVEIRLRDNSCSNTVKYTYTPTTQVVNRIQRRVKQKEPIFANYFSCLGALTNVSLLVPPTRELHRYDDKSTSDWDDIPQTTGFDIKPGKQKQKTLTRKEDNNPWKSTSLSMPAGQSSQERKLEGFNSKEAIDEADGKVDPDHLSRYLSLTNLNIPKESIAKGPLSHEHYTEKPSKECQLLMEASGTSSFKTITEENVMEKLSDFKLHSPSRENSPLSRQESFYAQGARFYQEETTTDVTYEDSFMGDALNTGKELEQTTSISASSSLGVFSENGDDLSKVPSPSENDFLLQSELSHLSSHFIPTVHDHGEAANQIGKGVWERNTDSGFSGFTVARSSNSAVVVPTCISEQSDSSIYVETTPTDSLENKGCTSQAEEDEKSTPTNQTTSAEAVNSTNDPQGAESNPNFSSQHENENASKDGNKEGGGHDHNDKDEAEDVTFVEKLNPPRVTKRIDHRGGTISLAKCDIILTIPPGALAEGQEEEIVLSVDWNDSHIPPLNSCDMNVAPIVNCYPTGLTFLKPVTLKIPHCAILPDPEKCKATVHCSQTDEEKEPDWKRLPQGGSSDVQVECVGRFFNLRTCHFTSFTITVNGVETLGKEIMFVPFGQNIDSFLDDQVIRLYLFDFHGSNWKKIQQHEKNMVGGKQLDTPVPYQVLQLNQGIVDVQMHNNTPGWVLDSDNVISFSFHTIWNIRSWNRCKFTWTNKTENMKFKCNIEVKQSQNENVLSLDIANHVKISPKTTVQSSYPSHVFSMQPAPSGPQGFNVFDVHDNTFTGGQSLDSGFTTNRQPQLPVSAMPETIIKYSLRLKLRTLLDQHDAALGNDWRKLAEHTGYENYIQLWISTQQSKTQFSPTEQVLTKIEQERKIDSLFDLERLMQEIHRPDAAEAIAKFQVQSHQPSSSSSNRLALTGGQAEKPMSTDSTPSPKDINQPLSDGGQLRYDFERSEPDQCGSYPPSTALSNQENTAPKRPYTDFTHDDDSTPSNNNHLHKELNFNDPTNDLQDELENLSLSSES